MRLTAARVADALATIILGLSAPTAYTSGLVALASGSPFFARVFAFSSAIMVGAIIRIASGGFYAAESTPRRARSPIRRFTAR